MDMRAGIDEHDMALWYVLRRVLYVNATYMRGRTLSFLLAGTVMDQAGAIGTLPAWQAYLRQIFQLRNRSFLHIPMM